MEWQKGVYIQVPVYSSHTFPILRRKRSQPNDQRVLYSAAETEKFDRCTKIAFQDLCPSLAVEPIDGSRDGSSATQPCLVSRLIPPRSDFCKEHAKQNVDPPQMHIPLTGRGSLHVHFHPVCVRIRSTARQTCCS
jgi:hypothetical protein